MRLMLPTGALWSAVFLLSGTVTAQSLSHDLAAEDPAELAKAARENGNAVRGAILFNQRAIACAKCHAPGKDLLGPDLTTIDQDTTDVQLVESLLLPSKVIKEGFESIVAVTNAGKMITGRVVKQTPQQLVLDDPSEEGRRITLLRADLDEVEPSTKSIMPDGLADQLTDRQQFLDILKYVMEIRAGGPAEAQQHRPMDRAETNVALSDDLQGMVLLGQLNCLACHAGGSKNEMIRTGQGPDLSDAGARIDPDYLERYIADPSNVKPGTTMPDVMAALDADARPAAARSIAHYLVSLASQKFRPQAPDRAAALRGRELFHSVGCVACHSPRGDDGSELLPGESVPLGRLEEKYNVDGLLAFLKDPHSVRPSGRMPNMQLTHWEARDITHYLLKDVKVAAPLRDTVPLDPALATKGKQQFNELGCVQCHTMAEEPNERSYLSLGRLRKDHGCLSGKPGNWPRYQLSESQHKAISAALASPVLCSTAAELTDQQRISLDLTTLNCVACHRRGDLGGVPGERTEYFTTEDHNLGEQGRIPPRLTGVGAKLQPKWMRDVLVNGRTIRPYMKTRMPQYGEANVAHLVDLFERTDRLAPVEFPPVTDQKEMRQIGVEIVGSTGMNCVACHVFKQKPSETMAAVDLVEMAERLKKDWFYHYMVDPQRFSSNTVMPSFWPGGRSIRKDVLDGDTTGQVEALWQYLLDGRQARTPRGLVREPLELVAGKEALMLRRAYSGIGKRGIGVGYPSRVNLAFDAEQMRLAMIWKGEFAEAGGVWRGQGSGTVRPLGTDLIRFPAGPELDDATNPWSADRGQPAGEGRPAGEVQPAGEGRPPHHQFKGYYLDAKRRPTFMYRFENIDVEDYPVDVKDQESDTALIRRTLTFTSDAPRQNTVFRAAADQNIVSEAGGAFLIGSTLRIRVDEDHRGQIVATPSGKQLRIPIDVTRGKSALVLEYTW